MGFLGDTWLMWLVLSGFFAGVTVFYRESRRSQGGTGSFTSSDEFSIKTILLGFRRGEGDLFLGFLCTMICFSLFLAGFVHFLAAFF